MTVANKITLIRILLIPVYLVLLYIGFRTIGTVVFVVACLTDFADGQLARLRKEVTNLGKFMDPFVDKLVVVSALLFLLEKNLVDGWVVIVIVFRELIISALRMLSAFKGKVISASGFGKLKTIFQMIAIVFVLLNLPFDSLMMILATLVTIVSGLEYLIKGRKLITNF